MGVFVTNLLSADVSMESVSIRTDASIQRYKQKLRPDDCFSLPPKLTRSALLVSRNTELDVTGQRLVMERAILAESRSSCNQYMRLISSSTLTFVSMHSRYPRQYHSQEFRSITSKTKTIPCQMSLLTPGLQLQRQLSKNAIRLKAHHDPSYPSCQQPNPSHLGTP